MCYVILSPFAIQNITKCFVVKSVEMLHCDKCLEIFRDNVFQYGQYKILGLFIGNHLR